MLQTSSVNRRLARVASSAATFAAVMFVTAAVHAAPPLEDSATAVQIAATLEPDDTLGDVLDHPALDGFAEYVLPWYGRHTDRSLPLTRIGSLLPYHSAVDSDVVAAGLDRLIENAARGVPVFQPIYSEAERRADPALAAAGLFFFPGEPGAPFAIIAPGGGFSYVGSVHEGFPVALEINAQGYNAFVVTYRTGLGGGPATEDMARAIDLIMTRANALDVSPVGYSVWGSSAGARMAASIGSHGTAAFGGADHEKPAAVVMAYTAHADIGRDEPPTFVVVGTRDAIAPPSAMERRIARLRAMGTEVEYRLVPGVGHGFGTGAGTPAERWVGDAMAFWKRQLDRSR
ncbi:alpha/beta hydrolase [Acuticoccus sediminis]|uniref:alpha/beta hydrolase n=1 Tax=Acuticoccus sediminis TaxID=2184697 RepID=UPI001CFE250B|nr:prolyl oligopeptidase family serine peptidase [Acuticoccus sediminis]